MAIPQEDLVWELDLDGNVVGRNFNSNAIEGPLENHQILNIVHTKAMPLFWEKAIEKIKMVRSEYRGDTSFSTFFGIGYKPTYFCNFGNIAYFSALTPNHSIRHGLTVPRFQAVVCGRGGTMRVRLQREPLIWKNLKTSAVRRTQTGAT